MKYLGYFKWETVELHPMKYSFGEFVIGLQYNSHRDLYRLKIIERSTFFVNVRLSYDYVKLQRRVIELNSDKYTKYRHNDVDDL